MKLSEIDPNFQLTGCVPDNTVFRDVWDSPFRIYGLAPNERGVFCRLPAGLLPRCSESVRRLAECTAGACVRFSTDAEALTVLWELKEGANMPHFAPSGKNGMELFEETDDGTRQIAALIPALEDEGRCRAQIGHHNYRVFGTEGYMERIERFGKPVIRYNSTRAEDPSLQEVDGRFMPPAYEGNEEATGHGGMDYAMLDHVFAALKTGGPAPIPLRAGLAMTLPGIYAEESARRGGEVLRMRYPWDPDWKAEF